jgi:hypothetical protein
MRPSVFSPEATYSTVMKPNLGACVFYLLTTIWNAFSRAFYPKWALKLVSRVMACVSAKMANFVAELPIWLYGVLICH